MQVHQKTAHVGAAPTAPVGDQLKQHPSDSPPALTAREEQVLLDIELGLTYKQIAERLRTSAGAVSQHAHKAYRRLGVANGRAAIRIARELGLLPVRPGAREDEGS